MSGPKEPIGYAKKILPTAYYVHVPENKEVHYTYSEHLLSLRGLSQKLAYIDLGCAEVRDRHVNRHTDGNTLDVHHRVPNFVDHGRDRALSQVPIPILSPIHFKARITKLKSNLPGDRAITTTIAKT